MFPGYVTMYKDQAGNTHLYFYPGLNDDGTAVYRDLDLSKSNVPYHKIMNKDRSSEYIFENTKILKIVCSLIDSHGMVHVEELKA